ncbi:DUF924 family protein [Govanella unica]|uniref:DUF924 domain-containing protein n=1 Tax=Govanella unica TaxID=2975056 RepID=A0A9X3Z640_9PROT|nr:DUF924 family protein [Govania unica]MDA5192618.1 DUF924 domain-containing protein [Govania unica]
MTTEADDILKTWFHDIGPNGWFATSDETDSLLRTRFLKVYEAQAISLEHAELWLLRPTWALALVLLLDQFPRNMFRDKARAYATDGLALTVAREAIEHGHDLETPVDRRIFFYLPFEHSEKLADQEEAISLIRERADLHDYLKYAEAHRDIIRRFGRFPHRNAILGRSSTDEETAYLSNGGETFGVTV